MSTVKTQGTELYVSDNVSVPAVPVMVKMKCPTGVSGLGGAADQIDTTCLDDNDRTFEKGLGNPGQVTVPFNLHPNAASHQLLFDLKDSGETLAWLMALSDGTNQPTLDSDGVFVPPATRSSVVFDAYISDVNIDVATNEIVRGTLILQRSGTVTWSWKTPV
jgi:hypothetical protein